MLDRSSTDDAVVVVGGGPVGIHFATEYCRLDPKHRAIVFGEEPWRPYDRVRLSAFVARELRHDALYSDSRLTELANLEIVGETRIMQIDRARRRIIDAYGVEHGYAKLVLATGSRPRVPPIPGRELSDVFVFRGLSDAQALMARQISSRATVVIGGGLLGLEAARGMLRFNTRVHVVEHEPRLMFHQLDAAASERLERHVERLGIRAHTGDAVQQIVGRYSPSLVRLRSGTEIDCDTAIIATGIEPNVDLARSAGIAVGRGIRVDDSMRTSDPDVYAIGECCEHRGQIYGLVAPGIEQATVAVNSLMGRDAHYSGSVVASSLKVVGCPVFSMGDVEDSTKPFNAHVWTDGERYRRINVWRGRLIGAVAFGDWDVARLRNAGLEGRRLRPWQVLRFKRTGELFAGAADGRVADWPAGATICTCRSVTRGRLTEAMAAGAADVDDLAACTGASTVCGSCKPLLAELIGTDSAGARPLPKGLLAGSAAALVLALLAWFVSVPYASSAEAALRADVLWTNSTYKQISGYSLLALGVAVSVLALRKRIPSFTWASFSSWQIAHVLIGGVAVVTLLAHTGFRFGANLNLWLMFCFSGLLVAGGIAGAATALGERLGQGTSRRLRVTALWLHILLLWPLPALLGFHVLKGYYF